MDRIVPIVLGGVLGVPYVRNPLHAELISLSEEKAMPGQFRPDIGEAMLTIGSCAAEPHESGQIRKEAAISGSFRVPQGHPI